MPRNTTHTHDRGASLAEYALLVALIAIVSLGAVTFLGRATSATAEEAGGALDDGAARADEAGDPAGADGDGPGPEEGPEPDGDDGDEEGDPTGGDAGDSAGGSGDAGGSGPGGSSGGTSGGTNGGATGGNDDTGGSAGGSDTAPSETALSGSSWGATSATLQNRNKWDASAAVTVFGTNGRPLTGVSAGVQIKVVQVYRTWDGHVRERSWTDQANLVDGVGTFRSNNLNTGANGQEAVLAMRYEVTNVVYHYPADPSVKWDGAMPDIRVDAP